MNTDLLSPNITGLDQKLTPDIVEDLFKIMLCRETGNEEYVKKVVEKGYTIREFIHALRNSPECLSRTANEFRRIHAAGLNKLSSPTNYRTPTTFAKTPNRVKRVLGVGSCLLEYNIGFVQREYPDLIADIYQISGSLPAAPKAQISDYEFQIIQLPLRFIVPDSSFSILREDDLDGHNELLKNAKLSIRHFLKLSMQWNVEYGIISFIMSLLEPQQNAVGRLMPRYDIRNPVHFVEKLNQYLAEEISSYQQAYFVDLNEITASHGKRFSFEDPVCAFNHGGFIGDFDFGRDQQRVERVDPVSKIYGAQPVEATLAVWNEMLAMYRTIRQVDSVKMVVIDLDDTLWRGIIAEADPDELPTTEGWPRGLWEALMFLKRRGVLLAIISKNEESRVREVWPQIMGRDGLKLEDFAVVRINWQQKSENMASILKAVNLLPSNVVYIDDNPSQREDIQHAYPDIRVLGGTPSVWRHSLLWAPETQVASITTESATRTSMIQAQVQREDERQNLSSDDFLRSLDVQMTIFQVTDVQHPRFGRVIELINKTNQFNTTGKRWTLEECMTAFKEGVRFYAFQVSDRFTDYGLVGVLIAGGGTIRQFVMSCRIMSLDAELAAVAHVSEQIRALGGDRVFAAMEHTERNLPCRDVYARCGFVEVEGGWQALATVVPKLPQHIALTAEPPPPAQAQSAP